MEKCNRGSTAQKIKSVKKVEENISESEDRSFEVIQSEEKKEEKKKRNLKSEESQQHYENQRYCCCSVVSDSFMTLWAVAC